MISQLGKSVEKWVKEREEEIKKGRQKGRQEGREEGEKEKALKVAQKLLLKGMTIDEIAEITELSRKEIEELGE